jgi:hypothetical protein
VTQPDISAIEAEQQDPRLSTLQKLAKACRISLGALVEPARATRFRSRFPLPKLPSDARARQDLASKLQTDIQSLLAERRELERRVWGTRGRAKIINQAVATVTSGPYRTVGDVILDHRRIALTPREERAELRRDLGRHARRRAGTLDAAQRLAAKVTEDTIAEYCRQAGLTPEQYRSTHARVAGRLDDVYVRLAAVDPTAFIRFYSDAVSCGDLPFTERLLEAALAGLPSRRLWRNSRSSATTSQGRRRWDRRHEVLFPLPEPAFPEVFDTEPVRSVRTQKEPPAHTLEQQRR